MGLGKTITCVSLMAATIQSARAFAASPLTIEKPNPDGFNQPDAAHFSGRVWGMPEIDPNMSAKNKAKAQRAQDKLEAQATRASRIKTKSRATLILCPLSTVANWEEQFREHWKGEVHVVGGSGSSCAAAVAASSSSSSSSGQTNTDTKPDQKPRRVRQGTPLRVYVYHGNARRPDPAFLADFDAVITTYATLASEYSKQNRSITPADAEDDDDGSSDGGLEVDAYGNAILKLPKPKKLKRKISGSFSGNAAVEATSALQSVHWFRVVLDEAQ
jgi:SNF2 family DNA or RNA helicase